MHHHDYDFVFHMFGTVLDEMPEVTINAHEHREFRWVTPQELLAMPEDQKIEDLNPCIRIFYNMQ